MTRMFNLKTLPAVLVFAAAAFAAEPPALRNPFQVADVANPDGDDVQSFAKDAAAKLGKDGDANAKPWSNLPLAKKPDSIDGPWSGRWNNGNSNWLTGTAQIKIDGDRVYILYSDAGHYLIDAKREKDKLIGRWVNLNSPTDTSPFVGAIVDSTRIDGIWSQGRWDFQRAIAAPVKQVEIKKLEIRIDCREEFEFEFPNLNAPHPDIPHC